MCPATSDIEKRLRILLGLAKVLKESAEKANFNQGEIMCDRYTDLLAKLISIDPEASFLPDIRLKGSGAFSVNLGNRLGEARLASGQMVAYLTEKISSITSTCRETIEAEAKPFDAYLQIEKILQSATTEVKIIDPFVDKSLFPLYFHDLPPNVVLKILTKKMVDKFELAARKFKKQKSQFEVKKITGIHDRYLIVDQRAWMIGRSIKDAGEKPFSIIEIRDVNAVLKMFTKLWNNATKVI